LRGNLPNILVQVKTAFQIEDHMANGLFNRYATPGRAVDQAQYDEGLRQHMLSVYNYMSIGLGLTGVVAFVTAMLAMSNPAVAQVLYGSPLKWVVMLAPLGFVFFLSAKIHSMSMSTAQLTFWAFAAVMGLSLSSIFLVFTGASIARVFFITGATFGAMSLWGYTTKRDLSGMGSFLLMGLIGIIVASVVNIFLASSALQFAVSVIGVLIFTGLTAYDTQRIKEEYNEGFGSESLGKMALMGALSLYLNFINLFTMLLQLFGQRE
jgi:FtsH-binding integral membrane protein